MAKKKTTTTPPRKIRKVLQSDIMLLVVNITKDKDWLQGQSGKLTYAELAQRYSEQLGGANVRPEVVRTAMQQAGIAFESAIKVRKQQAARNGAGVTSAELQGAMAAVTESMFTALRLAKEEILQRVTECCEQTHIHLDDVYQSVRAIQASQGVKERKKPGPKPLQMPRVTQMSHRGRNKKEPQGLTDL